MREARRREREQVLATGERVALMMRERGVSAAELATSVRIQRSTLENLCSGQRNIPSDVLASIAKALGTNVDYLRAASDDAAPH